MYIISLLLMRKKCKYELFFFFLTDITKLVSTGPLSQNVKPSVSPAVKTCYWKVSDVYCDPFEKMFYKR